MASKAHGRRGSARAVLLLGALAVVTTSFAVLLLRSSAGAPADTTADRVFGQGGSFTTNTNTCSLGIVSASTLCAPTGVFDRSGNVYVADDLNHRVLEYDSPLTTDTVADRVFGQGGSFSSNTCNLGGISASSLCNPSGVAVDAAGNLYIVDRSNQRVLEYDTPLTTDTLADRVFGQGGSFTTGDCNKGGLGASSLCGPFGVAVDAAGNLYVTDRNQNRVLEYDTPLTTDTTADRVFGQGGSFASSTCNLGGVSASSLCFPSGVALDAAGNVYVTDDLNHRVLEYDTPLTTDTLADRVFGQGGSFVSNTCHLGGVSASSLCDPTGVTVDGAGNLYIAGNHASNRVLEYDSPLTTDTVGDRVFGQGGSFTSNGCNLGGVSANSLCGPYGVTVDAAGNLYVADTLNHRVLEYDIPVLIATPTPAPTTPAPTTPAPTTPAPTTPAPTTPAPTTPAPTTPAPTTPAPTGGGGPNPVGGIAGLRVSGDGSFERGSGMEGVSGPGLWPVAIFAVAFVFVAGSGFGLGTWRTKQPSRRSKEDQQE